MTSNLTLPVPPSRDPGARSRQVPSGVRRRYEGFLDEVRRRRRVAGLTQTAVAKSLGISASHYANFERGYSMLTVPKLFALADALSAAAGELVAAQRPRTRRRR